MAAGGRATAPTAHLYVLFPVSALLIAPALAASLQGRDIEDVLLLRDEVANLA